MTSAVLERPTFHRDDPVTWPVRAQAMRTPKGADPAAPIITIAGSVETVDSYDTAFVQKGLDDRRFRENPVFLRQHDDYSVPLGMAEKWWVEPIKVRIAGQRSRVERPATIFQIRFDVPDDGEEGDDAQQMAAAYLSRYRRGFLRGASIRFMPIEWAYGDQITEEERAYFGVSEHGVIFRKWELIELSAVTVPANEHALIRSMRSRENDEITKLRGDMVATRRELMELRSLLVGRGLIAGESEPLRSAADDASQAAPDGVESRPESGVSPTGPSAEALERLAAAAGALRSATAP